MVTHITLPTQRQGNFFWKWEVTVRLDWGGVVRRTQTHKNLSQAGLLSKIQ